MKKSIIYSIGLLLSVILFSCSYKAEADGVKSITKVADRVYYMNYEGDYCLDEYLSKGGAKSVEELTGFISSSLKKGKWTSGKKKPSDIKIVPCDFACSSITVSDSENPGKFLLEEITTGRTVQFLSFIQNLITAMNLFQPAVFLILDLMKNGNPAENFSATFRPWP